MGKIMYDEKRCKGCHFCVLACAQNAVSASGPINKMGYQTVVFNEDECKACGLCYRMCPDYAIQVSKDGGF